MSEFNKKDSGSELPTPSAMQLLKSTAIALVVAIVLLLTVIIPAEYGVDPTGVGRILGLKEMGEMKADSNKKSIKIITTMRGQKQTKMNPLRVVRAL